MLERDDDGSVSLAGLTLKQQRFAWEYVKDHNAKRAALRAGYTEATAMVMASRVYDNPAIAAAIQEAEAGQLERIGVSTARVLSELASIAFADVGDACSWEGDELTLVPSKDLKRRVRRAIKSVTVTPGQNGNTIKLEFHDKAKALERLIKCLGMEKALEAKVEVQGVQLPANTSVRDLLELIRETKR